MASGCRTGPPSYMYRTYAGGPVRQSEAIASFVPSQGLRIGAQDTELRIRVKPITKDSTNYLKLKAFVDVQVYSYHVLT
jgi:hypothetical protein